MAKTIMIIAKIKISDLFFKWNQIISDNCTSREFKLKSFIHLKISYIPSVKRMIKWYQR